MNITAPQIDAENEVRRFQHEVGGISICYLGQVGFLLQHEGLTIAIDPYLSYSVDRLPGFPKDFWKRNYAPPVAPELLKQVDLLLCTHDHLDHVDPETLRAIASASPNCRLMGPKLSAEAMIAGGVPTEQVESVNAGQKIAFRNIQIEPVAVAHESYEQDREGNHRYLGYLIHWDGITLFHAGDAVPTPELTQTLSRQPIDVGFLPINGRSEERHQLDIIGNFNSQEAVSLASDTRFDLLVPTHYDLYSNNGANLTEFAAAWECLPLARRPRFKAFLPGERVVYTKSDRAREIAVVIGAGKTGRGFIARFLKNSRYQVVFIDQSEELVERLNQDGGYTIHFFGGKRTPCHIQNVIAVKAGSEEAQDWLNRATVVFTAIGENNVPSLEKDLIQALESRKPENKLHLLVCENGATPALPLKKALAKYTGQIEIAEAAIFCSTIELPGTRLDIQSEAYDELPYDVQCFAEFPAFPGMRAEADFPTLLLRKIYTYNCFSACIAYLGAYKKYQWYSDAANDVEISELLDKIAEPLNQAISKKFNVDIEEQRRFSQAAFRKFKDPNIRDDVSRNARNVLRKLAPNDRLIQPAKLIQESGGSIRGLSLVIASALIYRGPDEDNLKGMLDQEPVEEVIQKVCGCEPDSALNSTISGFYRRLTDPNAAHLSIVGILNSQPK